MLSEVELRSTMPIKVGAEPEGYWFDLCGDGFVRVVMESPSLGQARYGADLLIGFSKE